MLGIEKRDLLKSNIASVTSDQEHAQAEFKDALQTLRDTYKVPQTELASQYDRLKSDYESAESAAKILRNRVKKVNDIADDLFSEWEREAGSMENESLKNSSLQKLDATKDAFAVLSREHKESEKSLNPVLTSLRDYTLYLKHNLNAQALGALEDESREIQEGISALISKMDASQREAERFLSTLQ